VTFQARVHTYLNRRVDRQKRAVSSALFDKAQGNRKQSVELWNVYESGTPITEL
jgi:hypothetical protein